MRIAARALFRACFVAGTPVLTPDGWTKIEELLEGDLVLTRSEFDPRGEVVARRVLQRFVRVSPVLNLHAGGRIIGTTGEHPFWVERKGWTPARELRIGDVLVSHDGQRIAVEGVADSGRVETVYNVEVEEHHTYFVGCDHWGFSLWAHNNDYLPVTDVDTGETYLFDQTTMEYVRGRIEDSGTDYAVFRPDVNAEMVIGTEAEITTLAAAFTRMRNINDPQYNLNLHPEAVNQGFPGVYQPTTGLISVAPSRPTRVSGQPQPLTREEVNSGWIDANGGHGTLVRELGGNYLDGSWHAFTVVLREGGLLEITWKSATVNAHIEGGGNFLPPAMRPAVIEAVALLKRS